LSIGARSCTPPIGAASNTRDQLHNPRRQPARVVSAASRCRASPTPPERCNSLAFARNTSDSSADENARLGMTMPPPVIIKNRQRASHSTRSIADQRKVLSKWSEAERTPSACNDSVRFPRRLRLPSRRLRRQTARLKKGPPQRYKMLTTRAPSPAHRTDSRWCPIRQAVTPAAAATIRWASNRSLLLVGDVR
jgi:hypothetical protein